MKVTINKHFNQDSPFSDAVTDAEMAKVMRLKYPKACSNLEAEAEAFESMVSEVREYEAWKYIGFNTFEEFCEAKLGKTLEEVEQIVDGVKQLQSEGHQGPITEKQAKAKSRSAQAAELVEDENISQSEAARRVGIKQPTVSKAIAKNCKLQEKAIVPDWMGERNKVTFRKLPEEAQEKVRNKEISVRAAAIAAGIIKVKTPLEQIRALLPKLSKEELAELVAELIATH